MSEDEKTMYQHPSPIFREFFSLHMGKKGYWCNNIYKIAGIELLVLLRTWHWHMSSFHSTVLIYL